MVTPITPDDIAAQKVLDIPSEVIACWNSMIAKNFSGSTSRVTLSEASAALKSLCNTTHEDIRQRGYLDIEPIYRAAGWRVQYDSPGYNESYGAYYQFSKRK